MKFFLKASIAMSLLGVASAPASASQMMPQWFHGTWDCTLDGRPATMVWQIVDDTKTSCNGGVCGTSFGVKNAGWFSDNGGAWVSLEIDSSYDNELNIRYLGAEPDYWALRFDSANGIASGATLGHGISHPLLCWNRRFPF